MKKIVPAIVHHLAGDKFRRQYEKVEGAIRAKAQLASDMEFHRTLANFYTERVMDIDPHKDWWGFADAKQKQTDNQDDYVRLQRKMEEAEARVDAYTNALHSLRSDPNA